MKKYFWKTKNNQNGKRNNVVCDICGISNNFMDIMEQKIIKMKWKNIIGIKEIPLIIFVGVFSIPMVLSDFAHMVIEKYLNWINWKTKNNQNGDWRY